MLKIKNIMCMYVLPVFTFVHHVCAWHLQQPEEDISFSGSGVLGTGEKSAMGARN